MNIYQVVSEELMEYYSVGIPEKVPESYWIAELVVARNRGQAQYMAWKTDKSSFYPSDITEIPRMSIHVVKKDVDAPVGLVTHDPQYQHLWRE